MEKTVPGKTLPGAVSVEKGVAETLTYYDFPSKHWRRIRANNPLERIMKEIRRRTRVVGAFPDGKSAIMFVGARLRHIAGTKWGSKKYLNMDLLREMKIEREHVASQVTELRLRLKVRKIFDPIKED